jgi:hypothetical protein
MQSDRAAKTCFYYGEELLEDAFYDKATEATWASLQHPPDGREQPPRSHLCRL